MNTNNQENDKKDLRQTNWLRPEQLHKTWDIANTLVDVTFLLDIVVSFSCGQIVKTMQNITSWNIQNKKNKKMYLL